MSSTNKIQEFARKVVKEELARLNEGHDFFLPIQGKGGRLDYIRPKKVLPGKDKLQANITQG